MNRIIDVRGCHGGGGGGRRQFDATLSWSHHHLGRAFDCIHPPQIVAILAADILGFSQRLNFLLLLLFNILKVDHAVSDHQLLVVLVVHSMHLVVVFMVMMVVVAWLLLVVVAVVVVLVMMLVVVVTMITGAADAAGVAVIGQRVDLQLHPSHLRWRHHVHLRPRVAFVVGHGTGEVMVGTGHLLVLQVVLAAVLPDALAPAHRAPVAVGEQCDRHEHKQQRHVHHLVAAAVRRHEQDQQHQQQHAPADLGDRPCGWKENNIKNKIKNKNKNCKN